MEVNEPIWLDKAHPNFSRWQKGRDTATDRGKFTVTIIEQYKICNNLTVLDLGSGEGGTTEFLSINNNVFSVDINLVRLLRQPTSSGSYKINADAMKLPFKRNSFDLIILQDVIEHIENNSLLLEELSVYLKDDAVIYLSTPNKFSVFNIISDPHWGLPLLCLFNRSYIKKYFLSRFRKEEAKRKDIAELLSLNEFLSLSSAAYKPYLNTVTAVQELLKGNKGIVWSNFHLSLIRIIKAIKLNKLLILIANNKPGIVNKYLTPTFYIILMKHFPK